MEIPLPHFGTRGYLALEFPFGSSGFVEMIERTWSTAAGLPNPPSPPLIVSERSAKLSAQIPKHGQTAFPLQRALGRHRCCEETAREQRNLCKLTSRETGVRPIVGPPDQALPTGMPNRVRQHFLDGALRTFETPIVFTDHVETAVDAPGDFFERRCMHPNVEISPPQFRFRRVDIGVRNEAIARIHLGVAALAPEAQPQRQSAFREDALDQIRIRFFTHMNTGYHCGWASSSRLTGSR